MQHTKEPWEVKDQVRIVAKKETIATLFYSLLPLKKTRVNAHRIVACINGCAGIENPGAVKKLLQACKCLLADLEGATELFDGNVDDCWHQSIAEGKKAISETEESS